jgi:hypothetical protein
VTDEERTQPNGMVVGYLEIARRTGTSRVHTPEHPVSSSARDDVFAQPYQWRTLPTLHSGRCNFDGFCWKGLDYWPYTLPSGKTRTALDNDVRFGNMVGVTPRAIAAPGPHGAVATQQYEMLRLGSQECEALLFTQAALTDPATRAKIGEGAAQRYAAELESMLDAVETGVRFCIGADYAALSRRIFTIAGEVAARTGDL